MASPTSSKSCSIAKALIENSQKYKTFPTACRIPVWPFVVVVKAGRIPPEGRFQEKTCRNIWLLYTTPTTTTRP
jgi:hypothetical protein